MKDTTAPHIAQHAAQLLNAAAPATARPQTQQIASAAARLLGIGPASAPTKPAGLMGRLQRMFGAKS